MRSKATSVWLPRVLFESLLVTVSILLALGLDEWRDNRQDAKNIEKALFNFLSEIQQNKAGIEDAAPFNKGLRHVLSRRQEVSAIDSVPQFVNIIESYNSVVLRSTAWETAIATGSLAKMDFNLVSALSIMYSLQSRYQELNRSGMSELTSPQNLSADKLDLAVYNSIRYLDEVTQMETELGIVYSEAEAVVQSAIGGGNDDAAFAAALIRDARSGVMMTGPAIGDRDGERIMWLGCPPDNKPSSSSSSSLLLLSPSCSSSSSSSSPPDDALSLLSSFFLL